MSDFISEVLLRTNLQSLREFILHGTECIEFTEQDYEERITSAQNDLMRGIRELVSDPEIQDELISTACQYGGEIENLYTEIGLRSGLSLILQMLAKKMVEEGNAPEK